MSATAIAGAVGAGAFAASAQEDPTNIVADQIRAQGYKCDSPQSAKQDAQASKPDEAVWILQCESGSYRVRLIPDMAATVETARQEPRQQQVGLILGSGRRREAGLRPLYSKRAQDLSRDGVSPAPRHRISLGR